MKYYQGNRSPNDAQRQAEGCSTAWLHHKGRNRHHLEYWIDYDPAGSGKLIGNKMPLQFVAGMFCDRVAASKVYKGKDYTDASPWEYYDRAGSLCAASGNAAAAGIHADHPAGQGRGRGLPGAEKGGAGPVKKAMQWLKGEPVLAISAVLALASAW